MLPDFPKLSRWFPKSCPQLDCGYVQQLLPILFQMFGAIRSQMFPDFSDLLKCFKVPGKSDLEFVLVSNKGSCVTTGMLRCARAQSKSGVGAATSNCAKLLVVTLGLFNLHNDWSGTFQLFVLYTETNVPWLPQNLSVGPQIMFPTILLIWEVAINGRASRRWTKIGPFLWKILLNNRFKSFLELFCSRLV